MDKDKQVVPLGNSDNIFVQSNDFIQAKYKDSITFWEMIIFGRMCTLIDPNDTDFKEYRIYIKDLINLAEVEKSGQLYDRILDAATKLRKREITVQMKNEIGEERVLDTYLVTGVERALKVSRSENAYISLTFHPRLKPFLLELKRDFTKFDIRNYKFLHSGTITRLYQLLKSYYDRRKRDPLFDLQELKQMIGVADKYSLYANFRIKVLDEAQRKLEAGTDIKFTYEEVKNGNKVTGILFHIAINEGGEFGKLEKTRKTTKNTEGGILATDLLLEHIEGTPSSLEETTILDKFGVSSKVFQSLIQKHSTDDIAKAVRVTERAIAAGKIKGKVAGFFVEAVRRGYTDAEEDKPTIDTGKSTKPKVEIDTQSVLKNEKRKASFEQDKNTAMTLLASDKILQKVVMQRLNTGILFNSYDDNKSFEDNLKNPLLLAAAVNIVKEEKGF